MEQQNTMPHKERMFSRAFSFKGRIKRAEFVWSYIITWLAGNIISLFAETIMINPEYPTLSDVIMVACCALCMSFIASLYPAIKASKIRPAEELSGN